MNKESKLLVCLFSDANFLAVNILETLLSKNCLVTVVTDNKQGWLERSSQLSNNPRFSIINLSEYKNLTNFNYAIFCGGFIQKEKAETDFKKFISNKNFGYSKTLAIFPFEIFSLRTSSKISISDNAGIIYTGDLMGPRIDLDSDLLLPTLINEMAYKRSVTLGVGEIFYPSFAPDVSKVIVKWLMSFGPYGKETFLVGHQVSSSDFWKQNIKSFPDLKVLYDTKIETRFIPKGYEISVINSNLNICLNETYKWLIQKGTKTPENKIKSPIKVKIKKPTKLRFLKPFVLPVLLVLFFPLITTLISGIFMYFSYRQFLTNDVIAATNSVLFAKTVFTIGKGESDVLSYVPMLGRFYTETSYISSAGIMLSDISINFIPVADDGRQILGGVLSTGIYDVKTPSVQIKSSLDYLYNELSLFQVLTQENASSGVLLAKQALQIIDFDKFKNLSRQVGTITSYLPQILGVDTNKNYLILFENNMELRPTGGFIGSYGVANFGGGKMNGLTINDIYSADGQLKGHVEPPAPIKNYLNEANWWFRDSNWDPDFPTSAKRAEWFLNKEMDQQVDGVIAIDLYPIKNILNYTGPIFLPDYNLTITSENLYEKTQEEAQANSFPGSRQKASFLTALSRTLLANVSKMDSKNKMLVLKAIYESLVGRHIQVYVHDQSVEDPISKLGWDGKIQTYSCGNGCLSDFFGDVEANVGVNKANYFVKRSFDFKVSIDREKVTRDLTIHIENTANPALGVSGVYNSYLRIMIPTSSSLIKSSLTPEITEESGRQEVGVMVQINPGRSKDVSFTWQDNLPIDSPINSYGLYIRKQAGVDTDPISMHFGGITGVQSSPVFTLTNDGQYSYNTLLSQDFYARLSWKK